MYVDARRLVPWSKLEYLAMHCLGLYILALPVYCTRNVAHAIECMWMLGAEYLVIELEHLAMGIASASTYWPVWRIARVRPRQVYLDARGQYLGLKLEYLAMHCLGPLRIDPAHLLHPQRGSCYRVYVDARRRVPCYRARAPSDALPRLAAY